MVGVLGDQLEVTLLMASVFSVKLDLGPGAARKETGDVFAA